MGRARTLSPGFFTDEKLVSVSIAARMLFAGLWTEADREGRLEDKPLVLKMRLFPVDAVDVKALLDELAGVQLISRYQAGGRACLLIPGFLSHQHPHPKEAPSKLPAPAGSVGEGPAEVAPRKLPELLASPVGAVENASSMTGEPRKTAHGRASDPSSLQAFKPSGLQEKEPETHARSGPPQLELVPDQPRKGRPTPKPPDPAAEFRRFAAALTADEGAVFEAYEQHMGVQLGAAWDLRKFVAAKLRSHPASELCAAIKGHCADPWKREHSPSLKAILRDATVIAVAAKAGAA